MNKFTRAHMTKHFAHIFFNTWMALNYNYVECNYIEETMEH